MVDKTYLSSIIHECIGNSNASCKSIMALAKSDSVRDNIVNIVLMRRGGLPVILLVAFPQVEQQAERHQPHLILAEMQVGKSVIEKPGKQLRIGDCYPTCAFFESFSLSTFRLVPL